MHTQTFIFNVGILNGPHLNRLGKRQPEIYGTKTLQELEQTLKSTAKSIGGVELSFYQSNDEGALIDQLYVWADAGFDGVIINPGAYSHTSIALRDGILGCALPVIEVHISNTFARESFRHSSLTAAVCNGAIIGLGTNGYCAALYSLVKIIKKHQTSM